MHAGHLAQTVAVHAPLIAGEGEVVPSEAVLDDDVLEDADPLAVLGEPPTDVHVLTGAEHVVEAVLQELVPPEDSSHQTEPAAAEPGAVVHRQRATPIAGTADALQARLQRDIVARPVLFRERLQRTIAQHDVGIDQGNPVL